MPPSPCDGSNGGNLKAGNPINSGTGNKYQLESDYQGAGDFPLVFERSYNSDPSAVSASFGAGSGWRHRYERSITRAATSSLATAYREDGRAYDFTLTGNSWSPTADVNLQLGATASGWQLTTEDGSVESYNAAGQLLSIHSRSGETQTLTYDAASRLTAITHTNGRILALSYDSQARLSTLQDPAGGRYQYRYDSNGNLASVTYPDQTPRTYLYNEAGHVPAGTNLPHALTGLIDENHNRFASWTYDSQGRAIASEHAGGAEDTRISYGTTSSTVTDALGTSRTTSLQLVQGVVKSGGSSQPAGSGCSASASNLSYDANGNVMSRTDFNGNGACYAYDTTRNLETARVEGLAPGTSCPANIAAYTPAANTSERVITTQWHASYRLPSQVNEAGRQTDFSYDEHGNLLSKTVTDTATQAARTWTYTYNSSGQVLTEDGPRTDVADVTTYSYYSDSTARHQPGDLQALTNALGQVTRYTAYDAHGKLISLTDPNGLVVSLAYDPRGRLSQNTVGGLTTQYRYDAAGNLLQVTWPSGVTVRYTYDPAHRLTGITDALGNTRHYTLDAMANRTQDVVTDAQGHTITSHRRVFDILSRLQQDIGAYNQTASFSYDANGNATQVTDPLNHQTTLAYDALDRLIHSTDPAGQATHSTYDSQDHLLSVTDPLAHQTNYSYDGFGSRRATDSPDTGTSEISYDAAGNRLDATDARGQSVQYRYDALNRITQLTYGSSVPVTFTYDQGRNGTGHLTQMTDEGGTTRWTYDGQGRVASKSFSTGSLTLVTRYGYNGNGQLSTVTYPSGQVVHLAYDGNGQISALDANGVPLLSGIRYEPFGPVKDWAFGNGISTRRDFDLDGRLVAYDLGGGRSRQLTYDAAGHITDYLDSDLNYDQSFQYDALGRLTDASDPVMQTRYGYDANGNRTEQLSGAHSQYLSIEPSSNRLLAITDGNRQTLKRYTYDAAGHITSDGYHQFSYDGRGRLVQSSSVSHVEQYRINGLGQRVAKLQGRIPERAQDADSKTGDGHAPEAGQAGPNHPDRATPVGTYFVYDGAGHLLGEYTEHGKPLQETVWLGELPVAVLAGEQPYFVYADHLNSPRAITNHLGRVVWRWVSDPFGVTAEHEDHDRSAAANHHVDEDPDRDGQRFVYNLRFPGQYYDTSTGLHYNTFRDYDPGTGRYIQSDPIGLAGGMNTYAYVGNNPLRWIDPLGLYETLNCSVSQCAQIADAVAAAQNAANQQGIGNDVSKILDNTTFQCRKPDKAKNYCGANNDPTIYLRNAFKGKICGALKSTILHELSHSAPLKYSEMDAFLLENKAFGTSIPTPERLQSDYPNLSPEQIQYYRDQTNAVFK